MVETQSDRCFYVYHRTRASRAKACEKSYDKWKRYHIPSQVLIVPNPKKKQDKSSVTAPCTPSPINLSLPTNSPPMTDTTIKWRSRFVFKGLRLVHLTGYSLNIPPRHPRIHRRASRRQVRHTKKHTAEVSYFKKPNSGGEISQNTNLKVML
jgi:hypothetical protein